MDNEFANLINKRDDMHAERISYANKGTRPVTMYHFGEKVLMQDHISKRWDRPAVITAIRPDVRSYMIKTEYGKEEYIRSNRFLQKARQSTYPASPTPAKMSIAPPIVMPHGSNCP